MKAWLLAVALAVGCGVSPGEELSAWPQAVPPVGEPGFDTAMLQAGGVELRPGHLVRLSKNGAVFDDLVELIAEAERSVHIVLFIWRPGEPSETVVAALSERGEQVECKVVVDTVGGTDSFKEEVQPRLEAIGCEVRLFRPLGRAPHGERLARNHRKLVIVDGEVGVTGGFGIWRSWLGDGVSDPDAWRETSAVVRGPAVRQMQLAFAADWQVAGGGLLPPHAFPEASAMVQKGQARAAFSASSPGPGRTQADQLTQLVIASATRRLWISNAYFVPSEEILSLLERKRREGVDVRVLAAGPVHDWKIILEAQRAAYPRLLEAGIRVWEYQPSMMHAKTLVVDDRLSIIGSTNMDPLSLNRLEEGSVVVDDEALAAQLAEAFLADLEWSTEISPEDVSAPSPWRKLSRGIARLLGRWP